MTTRTCYRTAEVKGRKIFYREAGDPTAPTILLLHGLPTSSQMFRDLIPALADRFHLIGPDYVGFGHSDAPPRGDFTYTFDNLTAHVAGLVDVLGLTPPGASAYLNDLPEAKLIWLDAGHFVLDENVPQVAAEIKAVFTA